MTVSGARHLPGDIVTSEGNVVCPWEMSAERSEAKQTTAAKRPDSDLVDLRRSVAR
jgi:hypothetical protein